MSAFRSRSSARSPGEAEATPMLAVARTWLPLSENGWDMAAASRSGSPSRPSAPSIRMANSSPPSRATVSALRAQARNRSATAMRSRSPSPWPRLSFTFLKSSRSRKRTVTGLPRRCASASAWLTRSRNRARLASPVSGSWNAWWVSCSSSRRRSLTSRVLSTTPFTVGSCSRLVARISACSQEPSGWLKRHSTGPVTPGVCAAVRKNVAARSRSSGWSSSDTLRRSIPDGS